MKHLTILLLAAGLALTSAFPARATDFKVTGEWDFNFEGGDNSFSRANTDDRFKARHRLRTQVEIAASESLKGVIQFEIGEVNWGNGE